MRIRVRGDEKNKKSNQFGVVAFRYSVDAKLQKIKKRKSIGSLFNFFEGVDFDWFMPFPRLSWFFLDSL